MAKKEWERGWELANSGKWKEAEEEFREVISRNPQCALAYHGLGRALEQREEYEEALDYLDKAVGLGLNTVEFFTCRGRCHDHLNLYEEMLDDFQRVIALKSYDGNAHYYLGKAWNSLDNPEAALAEFDLALRGGENTALLHYERYRLYSDLTETDQAIASLRESLKAPIPLPNADWHHTRAHAWQGLECEEEAVADFRTAIQMEPNVTRHHNCCINLLWNMERDDEAEALQEVMRQVEQGEEEDTMQENKTLIYPLVQAHFGEVPLDQLNITIRTFPFRTAGDLQKAFDSLEAAGFRIQSFHATQQNNEPSREFGQVYQRDRRNPVLAVPPKYQEIDIGEEEPVRALKDGLWLLEKEGTALAVLYTPSCEGLRLNLQAATLNGESNEKAVHSFFQHVEDAVKNSVCYRGKILSLEYHSMYSGQGIGVMVHKLRQVRREDVILPTSTVNLLERNVMQFVAQRPRLAALGLAIKKGLLFYGPPGTGKTHTLHYLAGSLAGHTTFLVSADQVCHLSEYITLARLWTPSMVVIEDVDLIARDREQMHSPLEESLLNKLLNEMDGLRQEAEIMFVLTTNRPESLEAALAARPGRIDQAIEFPLPDSVGRAKLVRLYSQGVEMNDDVIQFAVERSEKVSASFIKELMRRSIQFCLVRCDGPLVLLKDDIQLALDELLVSGGSLNRKLLGATARDEKIGFA